MVSYLYIPVSAEPLRPRCTACSGQVGTHHTVVWKYPEGNISALCMACSDAVGQSEDLMRTVELATTMQKSFPEFEAWMARHGVWTVPLCHEDLALALGVPMGFPRTVWRDSR